MTYRIFDKTALEQPADFSLQLEIPESDYPLKNADGTSPVATIAVKATSVRFALAVLGQFNEEESILDVIGAFLLGEDYLNLIENDTENSVAKLQEITPDFLTYAFDATGESGETINVELTSPSGYIGFRAFQAATSPKKLSALATSFMPLEEDDDFDYEDDTDQ